MLLRNPQQGWGQTILGQRRFMHRAQGRLCNRAVSLGGGGLDGGSVHRVWKGATQAERSTGAKTLRRGTGGDQELEKNK